MLKDFTPFCLEEDKMVGVLFIDQPAAFDLCDHKILLQKLRLMGLDESALSWVGSYLSKSRVRVLKVKKVIGK